MIIYTRDFNGKLKNSIRINDEININELILSPDKSTDKKTINIKNIQ